MSGLPQPKGGNSNQHRTDFRTAFCRWLVSPLFVSNVLGRALAIERQDLELPFDRHRIGQEAGLAITSLVTQRSLYREILSLDPK